MARPPLPLPPHLHGVVFTLDDLDDVGVSRHRVRAADVERVGRGLFRLRPQGGPAPARAVDVPWDAGVAAALLRDRLDAAVSDVSAAQLHGLPLPPWAEADARLHVTAARGHRIDRPGVRTRRRPVDRRHLVTRRGLRCTSPVRTLWDLCAPSSGLTLEDLVVVADALMPQEWVEGFGLGEVRVGRRDLTAVLEQMGRFRGVRRAREVAALMREGVGSPQETRTRLALLDAGLPVPEVAAVLTDDDGVAGPTVDLAYPQWRIVIQYEGARHRSVRQQERDVERDRWCERHGWLVVKVTARDLRDGLRHVLPILHARIAGCG
ncbi:DUF559 domain-containing protein [Micrococcus flavus]|uniref:Uncharacterized protein n=1 Tax=Micrococcus flavus TaxID=384602 RepID=A0A4Y8X0E5_9MICC|nr:DUF559 domain-containing protein [Micrococcus flavus]MBB4883494.1 hypothetical protein [Micrococcus flavus]TFI01833.1 DUF559 domain-containing protein [Micrococcus flavus]GGK52771.1 hypothetical protein GCM10007073_19770 [Micrococcus flavus]